MVAQAAGLWSKILPKRTPEVYPLLGIMGIAVTGVAAFCLYALTKNDVVIKTHPKLPPWEQVDLERPTLNKFLILNQKYEVSPEMAKLKRELNNEIAKN